MLCQTSVSVPNIVSECSRIHCFHTHFWLGSSSSTVSADYKTVHIIVVIVDSVSTNFQSNSKIVTISKIFSTNYHSDSWIVAVDLSKTVFAISTSSFHSKDVHLSTNNYSTLPSNSS